MYLLLRKYLHFVSLRFYFLFINVDYNKHDNKLFIYIYRALQVLFRVQKTNILEVCTNLVTMCCYVQYKEEIKENMVLNVSMGVTSFYKFFQNYIRPPSPVAPLAGALIGANNTVFESVRFITRLLSSLVKEVKPLQNFLKICKLYF